MIDQAILELLLDTINMFTGIYDVREQCFIKVNKYGLQLFEVDNVSELNNILNKSVLDEPNFQRLQIALKTHTRWEDEAVLLTRKGKKFWAKIEADGLKHQDQPCLFFKINNIGKFKDAEREAQGSEQKFKAVFEHAALGIIMTDDKGTIVLANHFMTSLFGYQPDELVQEKVDRLLPEMLQAIQVNSLQTYVRQPKMQIMGDGLNLTGQHKSGTHFPVEVSLSHFNDKNKLYIIAFIQDVTDKLQAAQQLLDQKAAIEQLNTNLETEVVSRTHALLETLKHLEESKSNLEKALAREKELGELKSRFVALASHEFRTPLSAIMSSATLISKYNGPDDQERRDKNVQRIQASVGYLTDILEEFLSAGKLEEGHIEAYIVPLDWTMFLADVIAYLQPALKKDQKISFTHTGNNLVNTDKSLLRRIMINLLSNASKFSSEGSSILITSHNNEESFSVTVEDYGIGIPEADLKHLSERFFRGGNALNIQGTGLGLHIVSKYVETLKGTMAIQSSLGAGTTIDLIFRYPD